MNRIEKVEVMIIIAQIINFLFFNQFFISNLQFLSINSIFCFSSIKFQKQVFDFYLKDLKSILFFILFLDYFVQLLNFLSYFLKLDSLFMSNFYHFN